jgi:hypothetical protein
VGSELCISDRADVMATAVTVLLEWITGHMPAQAIRAWSGVPLGAAVAWIVCRSLEPGAPQARPSWR